MLVIAGSSPKENDIRNLHDTITRLARRKLDFKPQDGTPANDRLKPLGAFGSNPGALKAWLYVPDSYRAGGALVVVLHGCTQDASGYDYGTGWSRLADEQGFVLLFPEQQRANNPSLCFNWFLPDDFRRGWGEALSIRQMINIAQIEHGTDPARIFVTGLSAGGAMAAVMLATYPELFAGGAVIAGLPYGVARSVPEAFDRMRGHGAPTPSALTDLVRSASKHKGPWPKLSVWHGSTDATVDPVNAAQLVQQWRGLHGLSDQPSSEELVDGHPHRSWKGPDGRAVLEEYRITGLGHGTPLDPRSPYSSEVAGPFLLDAGISSTRRIAEFWGIAKHSKSAPGPVRKPAGETAPAAPPPFVAGSAAAPHTANVTKTIEDALRSAGLMR